MPLHRLDSLLLLEARKHVEIILRLDQGSADKNKVLAQLVSRLLYLTACQSGPLPFVALSLTPSPAPCLLRSCGGE